MRALITGIGGQDGWYLARHLEAAGYTVYGMVQPLELGAVDRLRADAKLAEVFVGDLTDPWFVASAVAESRPDEVYNLAAETNVGMSWDMPARCLAVNTVGLVNLVEAVRRARLLHTAILQAVSNDVWGDQPPPHNEATPLRPLSPYAVSKAASWHLAMAYRTRGVQVYCAILGNHESPRRGPGFITQLVATAVARIKLGKQSGLALRCLTDVRDWGHAADYVQAMHLILQARSGDYAVGTGRGHSVADLCAAAFGAAGIADWRPLVKELGRPSSVPVQVVDAGKAARELGWTASTTFEQLVGEMVEAAVEREQ